MIYLFHTRLVQAWEKEGRNGPCRNDIAVQHYRHRHGATETGKVDETCEKAKWGEGWDDKVEVVATDVENRRRDGSDKRRTVKGEAVWSINRNGWRRRNVGVQKEWNSRSVLCNRYRSGRGQRVGCSTNKPERYVVCGGRDLLEEGWWYDMGSRVCV